MIAGPLGLPLGDPLVALQVRARRADRAARWPHAAREVVEVDGVVVGALLLAGHGTDALRVVDLHLRAEARGRGIGTAVLVELCARADAAKLPLRLRTRPDNASMLAAATRAGFARTAADELDVELERPGG